MSRVFWDTNLFIYLFEGRGPARDRVVELRQRMTDRRDQLFTSALTLGEILVKPVKTGDEVLADRWTRAISAAATVLPFSAEAAPVFARIRAQRSVSPPDAIQLASAATSSIDLFITNDERLSRLVVPGIHFIASLERAFL
jgi:predicted nucleic acid-binding protein